MTRVELEKDNGIECEPGKEGGVFREIFGIFSLSIGTLL